MGRVNNQTPAAEAVAVAAPSSSTLKHFTHPHELHPLPHYNPESLCSGCKLQSSGTMYTCTPCNFTLHHSCAKLPQHITHPSHVGCKLSLLTTAVYPGGKFSCNACSLTGDSWSYHCASCEYDLHVSCASKPLKIRIQSHTSCHLDLTFKNPYENSKGFSCDICRKIGSRQWLYRCNSCEFDVHLDCTNAPPRRFMHSASTSVMTMHGGYSAPPPQAHLTHSASTSAIGVPYAVNMYPGPVNAGMPMGGAGQRVNQPAKGGGLGGNIMTAALQGFVEGAMQGVGQAVVQGVIGGGGDGGDIGGDMSTC